MVVIESKVECITFMAGITNTGKDKIIIIIANRESRKGESHLNMMGIQRSLERFYLFMQIMNLTFCNVREI